MGIAYKAIDTALEHVVALKLLRPELAGLPAFVRRFKREIRLTRQIAHPNVCRVHDLGEHGGILFLSMEWVQGETLRQLLNQAGTLEPGRAVDIAGKIAEALAAAHARGIIHRDLKPENVMIDDDGVIFVMDFGLAVGPEALDAQGNEGAVGTRSYMSPEQRRGEKVEGRSDLYSLGLILAEMLTGRPPDPDRPLPVRLPSQARRGLSPVLAALLAAKPQDRYRSAEEAARILAQIREKTSSPGSLPRQALQGRPQRARRAFAWGGVLLVLLLGAGIATIARFSSIRHRSPSEGAAQGEEGTASAGKEYFDRGVEYLREESDSKRGIGNAIQMFHHALEIDPSYARAWAGLGMSYWLWYRETPDATSKERAVEAVRKAFELDAALPEAFCARGLGHLVEADFRAAEPDLERAVKIDPAMDLAWVRLGIVRSLMGKYASGIEAVQEAIRLRPRSSNHRVALGTIYAHFGENDAALKAYREAIEVKPASSVAWNDLGAQFLQIGRLPDAIQAFERSLEIEASASAHSNLGTAFIQLGDRVKALENYRRATQLEQRQSHMAVNWGNLGDCLQILGRSDEASNAYQEGARRAREWVETTPREPNAHEQLGLYCAKAGDRKCALAEGTRADQMKPHNREIVFTNAIIRCLADREEEALDWLERAVDLGTSRDEIENEPGLSSLRSNPRYRKILGLAK